MEGDLADQGDISGWHLELCRKEDQVGDGQVERWPDEEDNAEGAKGSETTDDEREKPELRNHGIDALDGEHEANCFGLESESASKFKRENGVIVGLGCAEEDWHKLVEGNAVAIVVLVNSRYKWSSRLTMRECHRR